jgi:tetratricopeptide (TPR) repeat protein
VELPQENSRSQITRSLILGVANLLFFLPGSNVFSQSNGEPAPLSLFPDKPIERRIANDEPHLYLIGVSAEQYIRVAIIPRQLNMRARLIAPDGIEVDKTDNLVGPLDKLTISTVAVKSGVYRLEVTPLGRNVFQSYTVLIDEQRKATSAERNRATAENLLMQSERFRASIEPNSEVYEVKAISALEDALKIYEAINEPKGEAYVLNGLGELHESLNHKQKALAYFQRALPLWKAVNDNYRVASTLTNIGLVYSSLNEKPLALDMLAQSLPFWRELGDRDKEADTILDFAQIYTNLGEKERAINHYNRALDIWRETNNVQGEAFTLSGLGRLYERYGDRNQALSFYRKADEIWRNQDNVFGEWYVAQKESMGATANAAAANSTPSNATAANARPVRRILDQATEQELWQRIMMSNDPDAYSAYLQAYPEGRFTKQARFAMADRFFLQEYLNQNYHRGAGKVASAGAAKTQLTALRLAQLDKVTFGTSENIPQAAAEVKRYPSIESPDPVLAEQEFDLLVALTTNSTSPQTSIVSGEVSQSGQLQLNLPAKDSWQIGVVLVAPDFVFPAGNTANLNLPKDEDSTPARITLKSKAIQGRQQTSRIYATFWHGRTFLGKVVRDIKVVSSLDKLPTNVSSSARGPETQTTKGQPINVEEERHHPDLTVQIFDSSSAGPAQILITSDYLPYRPPEPIETKNAADWLALQYNRFFQMSATLAEMSPDEASTPQSENAKSRMLGFGSQLYDEFCPSAFKRAFRELTEKRGPNFKTIQIYSNNFDLPWELMRPVNRDGTVRNFLGVEFTVARWHWSESFAGVDRPPESISIQKLVVIAPQYKEGRALPSQQDELDALKLITGYERLPGQLSSVRHLFEEFPQAVVYFAGHGSMLPTEQNIYQYSIELEDGQLDLLTWRGLISHQSKNHPFLFFNACEIGQTQRIANFVDGWAPAVLEAGASGYIGALWPVSDRGAARFGAMFYRSLELRLRSGPASVPQVLTETRRRFLERGDPTFLAYVYFGDANLTLRTQVAKH